MAVMVMNFRIVLYEKTHVNVLGDEKSYPNMCFTSILH